MQLYALYRSSVVRTMPRGADRNAVRIGGGARHFGSAAQYLPQLIQFLFRNYKIFFLIERPVRPPGAVNIPRILPSGCGSPAGV